MRIIRIVIIILLFQLLNANAQQKPLEKLSKKELIEFIKKTKQKLEDQESLIYSLKNSNSEILLLNKRYLDTISVINIKNINLENQLFSIKNESFRNIEVLDLFNLGYQPFKNNEKQYSQFLTEITAAVVKSRMENIMKMITILQSKKFEEALKNKLFLDFKSAFRGYFDTLTIEELSNLDVSISDFFYEGLLKKTQFELESSSRENRWILLLESIRP